MFTKHQVKDGHFRRRDKYHDDFVEVIEPFEEADTAAENGTRSYGQQPADTRVNAGERTGYMAELETWIEEAVFNPIREGIANQDAKAVLIAFSEGTGLIKRKVLASYHNGLKARSNARQSN